jgi:N-acetyl sugar amidotransferase
LKIKKKNLIKKYNLPQKVKFCKKCTISNQRPRIIFDKLGICSACNYRNFKNKVDWKKREKELIKLLNMHRSKNGDYDVIVPCSGGKDGSFVAHMLKYKYNMNPLCVTWSPLESTEIGRKNLKNFIGSGFSHILGTPDVSTARKLTKLSFIEIGDPFQPFIYGQSNFPLQIASAYNVKLIMYGENGEVEYGGDMKNAYKPTRTILDYKKHYFSNISVSDWFRYGLTKKTINPYKAPPRKILTKKKIEMHFFGYYHCWDPQENFYYASKNTNFEVSPERTEGTYSKYASLDDKFDGFHFYLAYIKFGIGRATSDSAHEIRDGKITREEGISLVKKYDHEFPNKHFDEFIDFCGINKKIFDQIIDSWRSPHIWKKEKNNWVLKNPIWKYKIN